MEGRVREIFRDCFDLIETGCSLEEFKEKSSELVKKYTDLKEKMLCLDMLDALATYITRRDRTIT